MGQELIERSILRDKKKLMHFYQAKANGVTINKKMQKRIDESLEIELKRHEPKYYVEIPGNVTLVEKQIKRKIRDKVLLPSEKDKLERSFAVLKAR